jgi:hypothetical protein
VFENLDDELPSSQYGGTSVRTVALGFAVDLRHDVPIHTCLTRAGQRTRAA